MAAILLYKDKKTAWVYVEVIFLRLQFMVRGISVYQNINKNILLRNIKKSSRIKKNKKKMLRKTNRKK